MNELTDEAVLVVSNKWQTRALLAAELGERAGRDVIPSADVDEALGLIKLAGLDPAVLVVDAGQTMGAEDVERLLEAKRDVPMVLIASGLRRDAMDHLRERCAVTLVRPVRIGTIAESVVDVLEAREG